MQIFSFISLLGLFLLVGILASRRAHKNAADYLLAGRGVSPILVALSAAATKYSGYMFIGYMGYIYSFGISAIWIALGFVIGDAVTWLFAQKEIRKATSSTGAISYAELLSRWGGNDYKILRAVSAVITLVFLSVYAGAQFNAGSKALHAMFGLDYAIGTVLGAFFILVYSLTGGLRASIWTDTLQAVVMILSMLLLALVIYVNAGSFTGLFSQWSSVSSDYIDLGVSRFGSLQALSLFALGWIFNGIGTLGQPHIMVRFMALDPVASIRATAGYYFLWSSLFLILILFVGLSARLFINGELEFDAELALPMLAKTLLPDIAVGIVIGGIVAAVMSTSDSQIMSCAAVISEDFNLGKTANARYASTAGVTVLALLIALFASANVFDLVVFAWSALATSFGPLVIVYALGGRPRQWHCLMIVFAGISTSFFWRKMGLSAQIYECLPGILAGLIFYPIGKLFQRWAVFPNVRRFLHN